VRENVQHLTGPFYQPFWSSGTFSFRSNGLIGKNGGPVLCTCSSNNGHNSQQHYEKSERCKCLNRASHPETDRGCEQARSDYKL